MMIRTRWSALALGSLLAASATLAAATSHGDTPAAEKGAATTPAKTTGGAATPATEAKKVEKTAAKTANEIALMETNMGTVKIKFFPDVAPKAVENFKGLAAKGYYNSVTFHRVIDGFMIQGGDPTASGRGGQSLWGAPFEDEFSPKYRFDRKGLLAMANAGPKTNGSQFFITLAPTPHLNDRHTIFGEVIEGMDVVEKIGKVQTSKPGDKPVSAVTITKLTIKPAPAATTASK
jgi:cyclophilin family peptidyl-prolyl cis-trans isomerase